MPNQAHSRIFISSNNKNMTQKSSTYIDWTEHMLPKKYIEVLLIDSRKLTIYSSNIRGGKVAYQTVLRAFNDNIFDITDRLVNIMVEKLNTHTI